MRSLAVFLVAWASLGAVEADPETCTGPSEKCAGELARDQVLLQAHTKAEVSKAAPNDVMPEFVSPQTIAATLQKGIGAMSLELPMLANGDVTGALGAMSPKLWEAVTEVLPKNAQMSEHFKKFEDMWKQTLEALPQKLRPDTVAYAREGDSDAVVRVFTTTLFDLSSAAGATLPVEYGNQISKYFGSLVDAFEGVGEGLGLAEEGEQVEGVKAYYGGMEAAVQDLMGANPDQSMVSSILQLTDGDMAGVLFAIVRHMRGVIDTGVCWKGSVPRDRSRPDACDPDHTLQGKNCVPTAGGVSVRAGCSLNADAMNGWCYWNCPAGYEPAHHHCKQTCTGAFYIEAPLMCGTREGAIRLALFEMLAKAAVAATTQVGLASLVKDAGLVAVGSMTAVLDAFVAMVEPFGHPRCPDTFAGMNHSSMR